MLPRGIRQDEGWSDGLIWLRLASEVVVYVCGIQSRQYRDCKKSLSVHYNIDGLLRRPVLCMVGIVKMWFTYVDGWRNGVEIFCVIRYVCRGYALQVKSYMSRYQWS